MIVDEGDEVAGPSVAGRAEEIERALEIDMPELVGGGPLVARARRPDVARTVRAMTAEEPVDLAMAQRPDTTPPELGRDPSTVTFPL